MKRSRYSIRVAEERDIPAVMDLVKQLAVYEKLVDSFEATPQDYQKWGWGPEAIFKVLIAENPEKKPIGLALYYYTFSTFTGKPTLWLEDIFVPEELRGGGIGTGLLTRLAEIAVEKGCGRIEWTVLDWNEPSRRFYFSLGAQAMTEWTTFRLTPEAFRRLAEANAH